MGLSLSYLAVAAAGATLIIVAISMASKAKQKKAAAAAVAATAVSQTGQEGTVAATTAGDAAKPPESYIDPATQQQLEAEAAEEAAYRKEVAADKKKKRWPPDQCGLEDDADQWEKWEGPQRIKECQLSAADQERCRKMLDLIFHADTVMGKRLLLDPDDVIDMCGLVTPYLESEPVLIEDIPFGISVVGDLHGQMYDFFRVFEGAEVDGKPGWECAKFLFLGDFVDRGTQSLEITMGLFCLKMLHPDRIFLLRGNHEYANINVKYGLYDDLKLRYLPGTAKALFTRINVAFCYLSIAAIVGNVHFCVHGGISTRGFTRRQLRGIYKPIYRSTDDSLIHDMNWSDPATGLRGTCFNKTRKTGMYFGFDALCNAFNTMQVECLIRGHQMMMEGFSAKWYCCHTVFTATDYGGSKNDGGICEIDENGKILYRILPYDEEHSAWKEALEIAEGGDKIDPNEITCRYDDAGPGDIVDAPEK